MDPIQAAGCDVLTAPPLGCGCDIARWCNLLRPAATSAKRAIGSRMTTITRRSLPVPDCAGAESGTTQRGRAMNRTAVTNAGCLVSSRAKYGKAKRIRNRHPAMYMPLRDQ